MAKWICFAALLYVSVGDGAVSAQSIITDVVNSLITKEARCRQGETRKKEGSCKQYYECRDGEEVIARCMDCQNYDESQRKCRYVFDYPCHSQFPEPPTTSPSVLYTTAYPENRTSDPAPSDTTQVFDGSTRTTDERRSSSQNPTEESSTSSVPGSTAMPFGDCRDRRALPDCKYYLECHEGELVTRRCGWLQHFDSMTKTCSYLGYTCHETE